MQCFDILNRNTYSLLVTSYPYLSLRQVYNYDNTQQNCYVMTTEIEIDKSSCSDTSDQEIHQSHNSFPHGLGIVNIYL